MRRGCPSRAGPFPPLHLRDAHLDSPCARSRVLSAGIELPQRTHPQCAIGGDSAPREVPGSSSGQRPELSQDPGHARSGGTPWSPRPRPPRSNPRRCLLRAAACRLPLSSDQTSNPVWFEHRLELDDLNRTPSPTAHTRPREGRFLLASLGQPHHRRGADRRQRGVEAQRRPLPRAVLPNYRTFSVPDTAPLLRHRHRVRHG